MLCRLFCFGENMQELVEKAGKNMQQAPQKAGENMQFA